MRTRMLFMAVLSGLLAGCATQPLAPSRTGHAPAQSTVIPSADWENLGVSPNGNILHEVDKLSIVRQGRLVTFRERRTIFDVRKENFQNTPSHKVAINTWQIDCEANTYRLLSMNLFDETGRQVTSVTYNDTQIKPMPVVPNSASAQQLQFVCQNGAAN
ncbi:surface-adhesin E family protein [Paludibacterium sp. B53371]|uniref:surface-adhesin E family protein n=1 Tax=Paludibacterium sp. B53371 TaxID=2806263 RepID=UPI001C0500CA|nr:surface-adhesin E family protein [Paludibacterium sp. B53371]